KLHRYSFTYTDKIKCRFFNNSAFHAVSSTYFYYEIKFGKIKEENLPNGYILSWIRKCWQAESEKQDIFYIRIFPWDDIGVEKYEGIRNK
ncbi:MAG: hypothetical protein IJ335_02330, partial [Lachnospiraceae bacterium]|nr:hypothetical protein [Lachnospiraceae bacterium]